MQLKQLGFLRDLKGGLTAAFDVPKDKMQEATALIVSEMDKVSTNVSESIKSISDKVSEIIAAEEAEVGDCFSCRKIELESFSLARFALKN